MGDTTNMFEEEAKVINSSPFHSTPLVDLYWLLISLAANFRLLQRFVSISQNWNNRNETCQKCEERQ